MARDFRRYLYLDTRLLQDFLSVVGVGTLESVSTSETMREGHADGATEQELLGVPADEGGKTSRENVQQRNLRVSNLHLFSELHREMNESLKVFGFDSALTYGEIDRRDLVEISREFERSAITDMLESMFQLADAMREVGMADLQTAQTMNAMALLFKPDEDKPTPMVSATLAVGDCTVLFMAGSEHRLVDEDEFDGEMTLVGRVHKKIPEGEKINILDLLPGLPRSMRRSRGSKGDFKETLLGAFEKWPDELGGPVSRDALEVQGPAIVVTPLAVFD